MKNKNRAGLLKKGLILLAGLVGAGASEGCGTALHHYANTAGGATVRQRMAAHALGRMADGAGNHMMNRDVARQGRSEVNVYGNPLPIGHATGWFDYSNVKRAGFLKFSICSGVTDLNKNGVLERWELKDVEDDFIRAGNTNYLVVNYDGDYDYGTATEGILKKTRDGWKVVDRVNVKVPRGNGWHVVRRYDPKIFVPGRYKFMSGGVEFDAVE